MAFTTVGYYESQAADGLTLVAAMTDQHVNVSGDNIRVPGFASRLMLSYAAGINILNARIETPTLQAGFTPDLAPLNVGATEPITPAPIVSFLPNGLQLTPGEDMRVYVDNADNAEPQYVFNWLYDKIDALPPGPINTVKATGATTAVANTWTICPLTFAQQLPAGRYAIAGLRVMGATCVAARLVIPGSPFRPGTLGNDLMSDMVSDIFRNGKLGNWGEFEHTYPPQIEIACTAADTAQTVFIDLVGPF